MDDGAHDFTIHPTTEPRPVLGVYMARNSAAYYRLRVPLEAAYGPDQVAIAQYHEMTESQVRAAQLIVISRIMGTEDAQPAHLRGILDALRRDSGGARIIIDDDDDNRGYHRHIQHATARELDGRDVFFRHADGVTTTNTVLAGRLHRLNRAVRVVPNYVRPDHWPDPAPRADTPAVIVLAGSRSHLGDWEIVLDALRTVVAWHGDAVQLRVCGFLPTYLAPYVDDYRPWSRMDDYPAMLAGAHIALAPLPDTSFNRCKSPIKLYEYALAGAAVIASPCQYGPVLTQAGLAHAVARTAREWTMILDRYIQDSAYRAADAARLRRYVTDQIDARRHGDAMRASYGYEHTAHEEVHQ